MTMTMTLSIAMAIVMTIKVGMCALLWPAPVTHRKIEKRTTTNHETPFPVRDRRSSAPDCVPSVSCDPLFSFLWGHPETLSDTSDIKAMQRRRCNPLRNIDANDLDLVEWLVHLIHLDRLDCLIPQQGTRGTT